MNYKNNYHTHTFRCGHASDFKDEEYVTSAIENGIKVLGFSDHIMLPGISGSDVRGDFLLLDDYVSSINSLRDKYKNDIKIHLGFEAEALPEYYDYYKDLLSTKKIEYLILGNHSYLDNGHLINYFKNPGGLYDDLEKYTSSLIDAMASRLFKYVCHPDLFMKYFKLWDKALIDATNRICEASIKYDIPLEINLACCFDRNPNIGVKEEYRYPYIEFWRIACSKGCKVIIGVDAHKPSRFIRTQEVINYTLSALNLSLNIIDEIEV